MNVMSKEYCLKHYQWGNNCGAWNFVDEPSLSVKLETMPPGSAEEKHFHNHARQFFYILKGEASFEVDHEIIVVKASQGIYIQANQKHKISNPGDTELEFLLTSQPSATNDRLDG